jgi:soluble lytic murein transglycosylase-like protein
VRQVIAFRRLDHLALSAVLGMALNALAGEQRYEPLAASVQTTMHSSVADRASPKLVFATPTQGRAWLSAMSQRLAQHIADERTRLDFLITVQYEAMRAGLDPQMVLALIEVESKFRKYAVSSAGARGYMQVMPFWVDLIGTANQDLFKLRTNLRYGCVILRHYLEIEGGDIYRALGRYNGSSSSKSAYSVRVVRAWQTRWLFPGEGRARASPTQALPLRYRGQAQ